MAQTTRGKRNRLQREGGFILITVYGLLALLVIFAVAGVTCALADLRASQRTQANLQAFYLGEAGIDQAIVQFRNAGNWAGGTSALGGGTYTVGVTPLGGNRQRVNSTGSAGLSGGTVTCSVETILQATPNPLFRYAAFAERKMKMKGNSVTDSYDSSKGPYDNTTAGSNGDIGTNSITKGKVKLGGHTTVHGDAEVGPGGDPGKVIDLKRGATITGTQTAAKQLYPNTPVTIPSYLPNRGTLRLRNHETLTLPSGIYWYENIQITDNGQLNFSGPAIVYVSDKVKVSGNGIGSAGNLPTNLIIYVGGEDQNDDDKVQLSGNAELYAGIFAPNAKVKINSRANLYGSIVGRDVKVNLKGEAKDEDGDDDDDDQGAGGIHYDESFLKPDGTSGNQVLMLSWQQQ